MPSTSSTTPVLSSSGVSQPDNAGVTAKESDTDRVDNRSESGTTSEMHPDICSGDLGLMLKIKSQRNLTDNEKFFLLKNHFIPAKGFQFPSRIFGSQNRQFQASWLERYNGLTYSPAEDGGFYFDCFLFGQCETSVKELGVLVNRPLINFKKAIN